MLLRGTHGSPRPRRRQPPAQGLPPAGVFGEVHPKSHPVHVSQLNYRLNFLFCVIPKSICVHTYLIGRLFFIRVGISFTSFSPLLRRRPPLTRKMRRLMRERSDLGTLAKPETLRALLGKP